jgi:hypothetical protein
MVSEEGDDRACWANWRNGIVGDSERLKLKRGGDESLDLLRIADPAAPDFFGDRIRVFSLAVAVLLQMTLT